jgi:hypothetical protein
MLRSIWYVFTTQRVVHSAKYRKVDKSPIVFRRSRSIDSYADSPGSIDERSLSEGAGNTNEEMETFAGGSDSEEEDLFGEGSGANPVEFDEAVFRSSGSCSNSAGAYYFLLQILPG